ncbi:peroxisomal ATPase PEX6 [Maniola hyperantus]|uniref:peroxisomal ATPase PEX6 n=1 Tax=Aphantopus hyperantus TaxID=2795564 RepID=UPI0015695F3B|nr:peroxisome assembly factor 2 [Maniola hyperantus]
MKEENSNKLWVLKFCLKVLYPKFNIYTFLVFLAIKYRYYVPKGLLTHKKMNVYKVKSLPKNITTSLVKEHIQEENVHILSHKCIIIPKDHFIQLSVENFFYKDNGVLWVIMKLSPDLKKKYKFKNCCQKEKSNLKYNLDFVTSEIHKKLWTSSNPEAIENERIVPLVGSNFVHGNIVYSNDEELLSIASSFNLDNSTNIEVSFHPIPSFEYSPKIAAAAEVSLIVNEYDLENDFLKEVLSNYFEIPKIVSLDDVIGIELTPSILSQYCYKYLDMIESTKKLYFKCKKLQGDDTVPKVKTKIVKTYYIVKGVTQLTLGENTHATKPKHKYLEVENSKGNLYKLRSCPDGLREKFNQIQDAINPFLTGEIDELSSSMASPIIPMLLLTGSTGSGRHLLVKTLARCNGLNSLHIDCNGVQNSTAKQTESKISSMIQKAKAAAPAIVLLDNFEVLAVDAENNEDFRVMEYFIKAITDLYENYTKHPIIFIAVTEKVDLKPNMMRIFLEKFHIPKLNAQQRYELLQWYASVMSLNIYDNRIDDRNSTQKYIHIDSEEKEYLHSYIKDVLFRVASKTETFVYGDLDTLMHFAMRESYLKQTKGKCQISSDPNLCLVQEEDFNNALESIRSLQSQHLDAPKILKVYWEDIGGLEKLKKELLKTIEFPIKFPHLFKMSSLKRSGILLYGPPGCGKTLVAKAVSTELNVSFMSVKGPELLNMYIGQSEENVRKVFEAARASSPCIVFLDELDALAPRRGAAGDSGGASDRVVSQLLAEVDGVASGEDADTSSFVFIMGATNRPDLLEQSLLRPGRLDKLIYVGPYTGLREKTSVLNALSRSYKLRPEVKLEDVAAALPERCTGADLLQVVSVARSAAVRGLVDKLHAGQIKESDLSSDSVLIGVSELWQGVEAFRPSVTEEELSYYESLQSQM